MSETRSTIVICGAGIAGIAAAYELAVRRGMPDVVVVDERPPLSLTSDKSTECYRNWWPGPGDAMVGLMNRSIDLLEQLADASGNVFGLNRRGYLYAATSEQGAAALEAAAARIVGARVRAAARASRRAGRAYLSPGTGFGIPRRPGRRGSDPRPGHDWRVFSVSGARGDRCAARAPLWLAQRATARHVSVGRGASPRSAPGSRPCYKRAAGERSNIGRRGARRHFPVHHRDRTLRQRGRSVSQRCRRHARPGAAGSLHAAPQAELRRSPGCCSARRADDHRRRPRFAGMERRGARGAGGRRRNAATARSVSMPACIPAPTAAPTARCCSYCGRTMPDRSSRCFRCR